MSPVDHDEDASATALLRDSSTPHIGAYDGQDVRKLQSLPGARKVFYLQIADIMNGDTPKNFAKAEMWKMWQSVASSLSMYEVNVTTDPAIYAAAGVANSGRACFLDQDGRSFSPLNAFGTTACSTNYRNSGAGYGLGRTAAHEIGHTLGMNHDGAPGVEYFPGLSAFRWAPIMGNYWPGDAWGAQALYQWSKGEYANANNREDDLARINRYLPWRIDDNPASRGLIVGADDSVSALQNRGQINGANDSDAFGLQIGSGGGRVNLTIDRLEYQGGGMLDVHAELRNSSGGIVAQSNLSAARGATINLSLQPGIYSLVVRGGSEGTPANGFSNYSSLGFFGISGTVQGGSGSDDTGDTDSTSTDTSSTDTSSTDTTSTDSSDPTVALENGVPVPNLALTVGQHRRFTLAVPSGATSLAFTTTGGSGNADLFVAFDTPATPMANVCQSTSSGNNESCTISNPRAGTYHVLLTGVSAVAGASLTGTHTTVTLPNETVLSSDVWVENLALARNENRYFAIDVVAPSSPTATLTIVTSGGTGDADIFVKAGTRPSSSDYQCRSIGPKNTEQCVFKAPSAGRYYILLTGSSAAKDVKIKATLKESNDNTPALTSGVTVTGLNAATNVDLNYTINVPAGAKSLVVTTSGGTGDIDIFMLAGGKPTLTNFACKADGPTTRDTCTLAVPVAGIWNIMLHGPAGTAGASNFSVVATVK